jgi:hypothetical protein
MTVAEFLTELTELRNLLGLEFRHPELVEGSVQQFAAKPNGFSVCLLDIKNPFLIHRPMAIFKHASVLLATLLTLNASLPLHAKTLTFDQEKCHLDVPDNWTEQKVEGNQAAFVNADQTKSFTMRIGPCPETITVDNPSFLNGVESSMTARGVSITDRQSVQVAGLDAHAIDATQTAPAGMVYNRMTLVLANGLAYGLYTSKVGAKPWEDDELAAIIKSFGFFGEPQIHKRADPMDKIGYYLGVFIAFLAVISIFKWIRLRAQRRSQTAAPSIDRRIG